MKLLCLVAIKQRHAYGKCTVESASSSIQGLSLPLAVELLA